MRLFIALALPASVTAALEAAQDQLRRAHPPVKWVNPTSIHLTLQFLGEQDAALVPDLLQALTAIDQMPVPLPRLQLAPIGAFPTLYRPQTIWMGVGGETDRLGAVQNAVVAATTALGLPDEMRPFRAHLTLGRVRRDANRQQLKELARVLEHAPPPPHINWLSGPPVLYQSTLEPGGAVYRALGPEDRRS